MANCIRTLDKVDHLMRASGNCTGISENSVAAWANTQKVFTHSQSIVSQTKKAGDRIIYGRFGRVRGEIRKKSDGFPQPAAVQHTFK